MKDKHDNIILTNGIIHDPSKTKDSKLCTSEMQVRYFTAELTCTLP